MVHRGNPVSQAPARATGAGLQHAPSCGPGFLAGGARIPSKIRAHDAHQPRADHSGGAFAFVANLTATAQEPSSFERVLNLTARGSKSLHDPPIASNPDLGRNTGSEGTLP